MSSNQQKRMPKKFAGKIIIVVAVLIGTVLAGKRLVSEQPQFFPPEGALPIAVLGDSDSHSYGDQVNDLARGGAYQEWTFNWLEAWNRLRPHEIDLGAFQQAGSGRTLAKIQAYLGGNPRVPPKMDYAFNYALSGLTCASLQNEWPEQGRWLLARLRNAPRFWENGLIVIRLGVNDFGQQHHLQQWSDDPASGKVLVDRCLEDIADMVTALRDVSSAYIALVGISHDYDLPFTEDYSPEKLTNIIGVLDHFDRGLIKRADGDPRIAIVQDSDWYRSHFGSHREGIRPDAQIGGVQIVNAVGNNPDHLILEDHHAGTVAAGLFLQDAIRQLNQAFELDLTPVTDEELIALAGLSPSQ